MITVSESSNRKWNLEGKTKVQPKDRIYCFLYAGVLEISNQNWFILMLSNLAYLEQGAADRRKNHTWSSSWPQAYFSYELHAWTIASLTLSLRWMSIGSSATSNFLLALPLWLTFSFCPPLWPLFISSSWKVQSHPQNYAQ